MYRIMIVDDEPLILEQLHMLIDHAHWNVEIVQDCHFGGEALEKLSLCNPDIIITDIHMPDMDGLQLIHTISERISYPVIFIVLSGYDRFEYAKQAIQLNVSEYLLKPIFEEELGAAIKKAISQLEESRRRESLQKYILREGEIKPFSFGHFYGMNEAEEADTSYTFISHQSILDNISMMLPELAQKSLEAFCDLCREKGVASSMVLTSAVNMLCEASKEKELSDLFDLKEWINCMEQCDTLKQLKLLMEEWITICCVALKQKRVQKSNVLLTELKNYVDAHYCESFTLVQLAEKLHANSTYLGYAFAKAFGEHFHAYVTRLRIEKAKTLLQETEIKIEQIAAQVGYENYNVFKNNFVNLVKMPPAVYRNQNS